MEKLYNIRGVESCPECGEDMYAITKKEPRPAFWGAPCSEEVIVGGRCLDCGYSEDY